MKTGRFVVVVAVVALGAFGCDGPGADATFDPDAPGAESSEPSADNGDGEDSTRPAIRGRDDTSQAEPADLDEQAAQACGRAVTDSGRYSQTGYDRGISEGVEAGFDEAEMIDAVEELCGDEIREAQEG